ncbi:pilus assembly protein TadE [Nocardia yunnanensis]|uniref:Pilus assembly protein TadE n=1 Tax=Nocardia yunnanensis TaxID=2382165 RepID=A0A386Z987_9NOCA|nr:Rv3654c family TadE-like protein [Nocardia yunnanensis]AYF73155.1 pilus assembly protein TadE [Nocardia yunnanensis]
MSPWRSSRVDGDAGAATVTACMALLGILAVGVLIAQVGVAVAARHRIQAAADLGALAAAGALDGGVDAACRRGAEIADRQGARQTGCAVEGWDVTVTVEGRVSLGPLGVRAVRASARAGPMEAAAGARIDSYRAVG